jgi:hypothetical protein
MDGSRICGRATPTLFSVRESDMGINILYRKSKPRGSYSELHAKLQLTFEQRANLVVRLFSATHGNIADTASLTGVLSSLARRGFRGRSTLLLSANTDK